MEDKYMHVLRCANAFGNAGFINMIKEGYKPSDIYKMDEAALGEHLPSKSADEVKKIHERVHLCKPDDMYDELCKKEIKLTTYGDDDYPDRLYGISNPPACLYYKGALPKTGTINVAVIGARNCSSYGVKLAEDFVGFFANAGVQIVSGMARGIDGIGQQAALANGGYSLGILGGGVDVIYPMENRLLYDKLCKQGGLCSEYPPGTEPKRQYFAARNRLIAAFADAVLVIEAKSKSGTLITVDMALEQGRDVWVVPGRVTDPLSEGCNKLILQGAAVALSPEHMLREAFNLRKEGVSSIIRGKESKPLLSTLQKQIYALLDYNPVSAEELSMRLFSNYKIKMPVYMLINELLRLQMMGLCNAVGNSYFSL